MTIKRQKKHWKTRMRKQRWKKTQLIRHPLHYTNAIGDCPPILVSVILLEPAERGSIFTDRDEAMADTSLIAASSSRPRPLMVPPRSRPRSHQPSMRWRRVLRWPGSCCEGEGDGEDGEGRDAWGQRTAGPRGAATRAGGAAEAGEAAGNDEAAGVSKGAIETGGVRFRDFDGAYLATRAVGEYLFDRECLFGRESEAAGGVVVVFAVNGVAV